MGDLISSVFCFIVGFALVSILGGEGILDPISTGLIFLASVIFGSALFIGRKIDNLKDKRS